MAFKHIVFLACVALATAIPVADKEGKEEEDGPVHYQFSYSVHDDHTGDIKSQEESREGDVVKGSYTLIDADGHRRIVEYQANDHDGFTATVRREEIKGYQAPAPAPAPAAAKLIATKYIAPALLAKVAPVKLHYEPIHYTLTHH